MQHRLFKSLILNLFLLTLLPGLLMGQEIVVNEYFNSASQNDEWTELVVVKDNLSLVGWFIGDNNAGTTSWQPKIKFKNHPLWQHLRAGTIITIDHASNNSNCNDPEDTDKSDGYIRVCCRNSTYFEGGSTTTLFLADEGDFVQLVDPNGKMVHAIGHDDNPGSSVEGGTCFNVSSRWTNTTAAETATRPCGNFLFYRFAMQSPTALKAICGTTADFYAGMQTGSNNPFIDTSDTPFTGIGNSGPNNNWITKLRAPVMTAQTVCPSLSPVGGAFGWTFSWQKATDPYPADSTIGYLILKNETGIFPLPAQGVQYTAGQTIGTGNAASQVVAVLKGSGRDYFTDFSAFSLNSRYRVYAFRYVNTPNFTHPTRGRAYNTDDYITVAQVAGPGPVVQNDTLCQPGLAILYIDPVVMPGPGQILWFANQTGGNPILVNKDTLKIQVSGTTSYWVEIQSASACIQTRREVKAVVLPPFNFSYTAPDSACQGTPIFFGVDPTKVFSPKWKLPGSLPGIETSNSDSAFWQINIPFFPQKEWIKFEISGRNQRGCIITYTDSFYTVPFSPRFVIEPENPGPGTLVTIKVIAQKNNYWVENWAVSPGPILSSNPIIATTIAAGDSLKVSGEISTILPQDARFCKIKIQNAFPVQPPPEPEPPLKPINNLITDNGDGLNAVLDFDSREVKNLEIFNRWGKKVFSSENYTNNWKPDGNEPGCYFYSAEIKEKTDTGFRKIRGWVMVAN